jgi:hypothetical protein
VAGSGACADCGTGQYQPWTGASGCQGCAAGLTSAVGSTSCRPCPEGTYSTVAGAATCQGCAGGYFSTAVGATVPTTCVGCPANTFSAVGSSSCLPCAPGRFACS